MTFKEEKEFIKEKARKHGIELAASWYLPMGKNCLVARLPPKNRTEGGLWLAGSDEEIPNYGILIAAGLEARAVFADALIEVGDVVRIGRFEGSEEEFDREKTKKGRYILQVLAEGIKGSIEADKRAEECTIEFQDTADGGRAMFYVPVNDIKRKAKK